MREMFNKTPVASRPTKPIAALKAGLDMRGGGYAHLENMYIDYEAGGNTLVSIPGFRRICSLSSGVHSLFFVGCSEESGFLLVHAKDKLYRIAVTERDKNPTPTVIAGLCDCESTALSFGSVAFITDGERLIMINHLGEAGLISENEDIAGCSCGCIYDGRLFLSGNKNKPGRVYYSTPLIDGEPIFNSEMSFTEGSGRANISSVISLNGYLWLFKESADGEGDIICRHMVDSECYPTVRVIDGVRPISKTVIQGGEIVFLTREGLVSLSGTSEGNPKIINRSLPVNPLLLKERLREAELGCWMGYVVIATGERIYLVDPRGVGEWNWFPISPIGGYKKARRVYRYSEKAEEGCQTNPKANEIAAGEIYSRGRIDGELIYYSVEEGKRYSVYPTAVMSGGEFMPAEKLYALDRLMWFATVDGGIYLFNNDKRGASVGEIRFSDAYQYSLNPECEGSEIHPVYYLFDFHVPDYIATTHSDKSNELNKNTKKGKTR